MNVLAASGTGHGSSAFSSEKSKTRLRSSFKGKAIGSTRLPLPSKSEDVSPSISPLSSPRFEELKCTPIIDGSSKEKEVYSATSEYVEGLRREISPPTDQGDHVDSLSTLFTKACLRVGGKTSHQHHFNTRPKATASEIYSETVRKLERSWLKELSESERQLQTISSKPKVDKPRVTRPKPKLRMRNSRGPKNLRALRKTKARKSSKTAKPAPRNNKKKKKNLRAVQKAAPVAVKTQTQTPLTAANSKLRSRKQSSAERNGIRFGCSAGIEERREMRRERRKKELAACAGAALGVEAAHVEKVLEKGKETLDVEAEAVARKARKNNQTKTDKINNDTIMYYLTSAAKEPLLTKAEEIELSKKVQEMLRIEEVNKELAEEFGRSPSPLEVCGAAALPSVHEMHSRLDAGNCAKKRMVRANMRLVVSCARRYHNQGLSPLDLWQEGNLGLIKGIERYDPQKGFRMSTYVYWWIRQAITRAIAYQARAIRLPLRTIDALYKINGEIKKYMMENCFGEPSNETLAQLTGMSVARVATVRRAGMPLYSFDNLVGDAGSGGGSSPLGQGDERMYSRWTSTLSQMVDPREHWMTPGNPGGNFGEGLPNSMLSIETSLMRENVTKVLQETLLPREVQVLEMRYGLSGKPACRPKDMGTNLGISRERVRQIEKAAMKKLMQGQKTEQLKEYLWMCI